MKAVRWLGVLMIATALVGLPVAMWVSERCGLILATLGTLGLVVLGLVSKLAGGDEGKT